ncbi:MAG TPA: zf-HC2 domain-containing protein [Candidatus Dormibacteraeota bacterium]|jgi:hypothetical protein
MAERHVDPLFSAAYDDELDRGARRRFDAHLEGCTRCAAAFEDYRTAVDAVHLLPAVAMPATVRLPLGAPRAAAGRAEVLGRLRDALLHPQPVTAAATMAAVGIAAVVLAVHHGGGGTSSATAGNAPVALSQGSGSSAQGAAGFPPIPAPERPVPCPVAPVAGGGAAPAGYAHSASTPTGTGGELVLATPADSYGAGETIPIYARLTTPGSPGGGGAVVPCVSLETDGSAAASQPKAAARVPQGAPPQAPAYDSAAQPTPLAVATSGPAPLSAAGSAGSSSRLQGSGPLLSVTIPAGIAKGTTLRLVAVIPAHYPGNPGDVPIQVVLLITVR